MPRTRSSLRFMSSKELMTLTFALVSKTSCLSSSKLTRPLRAPSDDAIFPRFPRRAAFRADRRTLLAPPAPGKKAAERSDTIRLLARMQWSLTELEMRSSALSLLRLLFLSFSCGGSTPNALECGAWVDAGAAADAHEESGTDTRDQGLAGCEWTRCDDGDPPLASTVTAAAV